MSLTLFVSLSSLIRTVDDDMKFRFITEILGTHVIVHETFGAEEEKIQEHDWIHKTT